MRKNARYEKRPFFATGDKLYHIQAAGRRVFWRNKSGTDQCLSTWHTNVHDGTI